MSKEVMTDIRAYALKFRNPINIRVENFEKRVDAHFLKLETLVFTAPKILMRKPYKKVKRQPSLWIAFLLLTFTFVKQPIALSLRVEQI
jgi:hypothetical protein